LLDKIVCFPLFCIALTVFVPAQSATQDSTTAWHDGRFQVDVPGLLSRSAIVLAQPNREPEQAMPLGNGRLGVSIWSENGLTAQLNRADTLPARLSPGEVVIPGLSALTRAKDYGGRLDLYDGEFQEHGGGMTATAYVLPDTDTLIIEVTGANPDEPQTVLLRLWAPRTTNANVSGTVGILSEGWMDDKNPGASGRAFGALSAITAEGRSVSLAVMDPLTVTLWVRPFPDGHFRIVVASPHYDGKQNPLTVARPALSLGADGHRSWWHAYWNRAAAIKVSSKDGSGEYLENLRNIYLFAAAAEKGDEYPGSQAGVADLLSSARDRHRWDSSAFWHWNLRMQTAANISAGVGELNAPYFNLYRENLPSIENWTKTYMEGRPGACIPETMRFDGQGIEYESQVNDGKIPGVVGRDCDLGTYPFFNSRTLSTGAEVGLWVWEQYLVTNDREFLVQNYPVMASAARFLLSYEKPGPDGLLHTSPSNSHETQWDVSDPTTDIAAALALYPVTIEAAKLLHRDADLVQQLQAALPKIPPLPRTQLTGPFTLLSPADDAAGEDMIAESYLPGAKNRNGENIGLEPIWPYNLIGDASPLFELGKRSYAHRLFPWDGGWSFSSIQAARLDMGSEVGAALLRSTERSASCVNGFTGCSGRAPSSGAAPDPRSVEFYVEQSGVASDALQEALVQDYDGLIRIAPAVPTNWDFDGSVYVHGKTKVDVQVRTGVATTVVIESGITQPIKFRNPWPGLPIDIVSGKTGEKVVASAVGPIVTFNGAAGVNYLIEKHGTPTASQQFSPIGGTPATAAKKLGPVQLGLFPAQ
jgi:alpha-L-fucosidase 2